MNSICASQNCRHRPDPRRGGFVLVMALVLITVAGMSLAGLARHSLDLAGRAAAAQEDLQRRWGSLSCRRVILPQVDDLLEREARRLQYDKLGWPRPSTIGAKFALGGLEFDVSIVDEDAKVNLNAIYRRNPDDVNRVATMLLQGGGSGGLAIQIQPPLGSDRKTSTPFRSWGQIFDTTSARGDSLLGIQIRDCTRDMTCWGQGRMNVRRCSDVAIQTFCEGNVPRNVIGKLLAQRRDPEVHNLEQLITKMSLKAGDQLNLRRLLTDESQCHSMWLSIRGERRSWTTFVISHPGEGAGTDEQTFVW